MRSPNERRFMKHAQDFQHMLFRTIAFAFANGQEIQSQTAVLRQLRFTVLLLKRMRESVQKHGVTFI